MLKNTLFCKTCNVHVLLAKHRTYTVFKVFSYIAISVKLFPIVVCVLDIHHGEIITRQFGHYTLYLFKQVTHAQRK